MNWRELVTRETGKPLTEALFADVLISLETAKYYARETPRLLADETVATPESCRESESGTPDAISRSASSPSSRRGTIRWPFRSGKLFPPSSPATPWCSSRRSWRPPAASSSPTASLKQDFRRIWSRSSTGRGELGAALVEARPDKVIFTGSTRRRKTGRCGLRAPPDSQRPRARRQGRHDCPGGRRSGGRLQRRCLGRVHQLRPGLSFRRANFRRAVHCGEISRSASSPRRACCGSVPAAIPTTKSGR